MKIEVIYNKYTFNNEGLTEKEKMLLNSIVTSLNKNNKVLKSDLEILNISAECITPIVFDNTIWMWKKDDLERFESNELLSKIKVSKSVRTLEIILDKILFENKEFRVKDLKKYLLDNFEFNITKDEDSECNVCITDIEIDLVHQDDVLAFINIIIKTNTELQFSKNIIIELNDIEKSICQESLIKSVRYK